MPQRIDSWVSLDDEREIAFWTAHFAVDLATLEAAMDDVGNSADEVELWLERRGC